MTLNIVQVVLRGNFDIQPHRRVLLDAAPLLQLGGDGGQIASDHCQRLGHGHLQGFHGAEAPVVKTHQVHRFGFAGFIEAQRQRRAAVADVLAATDHLRPMNMAQRNVVGRREVLRRKGIQRADVNVADGIAFAGADGGQVAAGNDGQRPIAAQRAGLLILLLIIVADGVQ